MIKSLLLFLVWESGAPLQMGNVCPAFRQMAEGEGSSSSAASQSPSAQNNPYIKVAYLGVAYFDPLQV